MRVLIACEFSQVVTKAFRERGHEAYSCDLLPTEGNPEWHIQGDAVENAYEQLWDLIIAHPPCTYLTSAAEWAYSDGPYHQKVKPGTLVGQARQKARQDALSFVMMLMNARTRYKAVENPIGILNTQIRQPEQIIQPWAFGEDASKATCLWLEGLPLLKPTKYIAPRLGAGGRPVWGNQTATGQNRLSPSESRSRDRSRTFLGIARAMAEQWGNPAPPESKGAKE